jgi:nucleoside-diphosphate-sugar epimerase
MGKCESFKSGTITQRKLLDVSKLSKLGWRPKIDLEEGLRATYRWFTAHSLKETERARVLQS